MTRILIAIPSMDMVAAKFAESLARLEKEGTCEIVFISNSLIYDARNSLARHAVRTGADYILFLDSDMVFNPDILKNLLAEDKDILTGLYFKRAAPFTPVIYKKAEEKADLSAETEIFTDYPKNSLFEVEACGFGCCLIKTEVLLKIALEQGDWFTPLKHFGEDLAFCIRARRSGYKIFCDSRQKLGHVGCLTFTEDFYNKQEERP